jgi:hypothetical protein
MIQRQILGGTYPLIWMQLDANRISSRKIDSIDKLFEPELKKKALDIALVSETWLLGHLAGHSPIIPSFDF